MLAVDTNVLLRLLVRDDPRQALAADLAVARGAWVSHLVLAEALWVLDAVYERTAKQLVAALDLLLVHESLVLQDADVVSAALAHFRGKPATGTGWQTRMNEALLEWVNKRSSGSRGGA